MAAAPTGDIRVRTGHAGFNMAPKVANRCRASEKPEFLRFAVQNPGEAVKRYAVREARTVGPCDTKAELEEELKE